MSEIVFHLSDAKQPFIDEACDTVMDCGPVKLATLVSQASGDFEFREDLMWREQRTDFHVSGSTRTIYSVLAASGSLDILE